MADPESVRAETNTQIRNARTIAIIFIYSMLYFILYMVRKTIQHASTLQYLIRYDDALYTFIRLPHNNDNDIIHIKTKIYKHCRVRMRGVVERRYSLYGFILLTSSSPLCMLLRAPLASPESFIFIQYCSCTLTHSHTHSHTPTATSHTFTYIVHTYYPFASHRPHKLRDEIKKQKENNNNKEKKKKKENRINRRI